jgi:nicotinamide mononucleotide transporter
MTDALLDPLWQGLKATSAIEWVAVATGFAYALLIMLRRRIGWVFGAVSSLILALLAARARLPMQALLQLSYVGAAVYGWWSWSRSSAQPVIRWWHWRGHAIGIAACLLVSLLLAQLLQDESAFPFIDSLAACVGLLATWLLARVYLENWLYWIAIDAVSIYLFFTQGLVSTAVLYVLYFSIAVIGFFGWRRGWQKAQAAP